ncbi:MAG: LysR family transcriptional regulator [Minwuiales bacterium]|nr:LysR family transcriptional regulator [Minwuiales bacterium]
MNWNDLRYLLAVFRGGTLSAAARSLRVDQTTVARRLAAIEKALGAHLFDRTDGQMQPTAADEEALDRAERVESEVLALQENLTGADSQPQGVVRLTAVPTVINRLLIPKLSGLFRRYPALRVEALADSVNLSLTKREADIALRLARPETGTAICRRIGALGYSVYGPAGSDPGELPWLTYEDTFLDLPQARWIAKHGGPARLGVGDAESLFQAVRAGLGRTVLPDFMAGADPRLVRLSDDSVLTREIWLLVHPELRALARISATIDWLVETVGAVSITSGS